MIYVERTSKFKLQNSHLTVLQRIHSGEEPYKYHESGKAFVRSASLTIRQFMMERNLTNVMTVSMCLVKIYTL